jgi:hypothetical protein
VSAGVTVSSPPVVFGLNALGFLGVVAALRGDHHRGSPAKPPPGPGDLRRSLANAFHYARGSAAVRAVLARNFLFALFVSAIPALMPVIALKELRLDPAMLGLIFTSMGTGSVLARRPRPARLGAPLFLAQPPDVCRKRAPGRYLPLDGPYPAQPVLFAGGGDGRRGLDAGGFRALAGGPTGNCPLGAESPQRRGAHAVALYREVGRRPFMPDSTLTRLRCAL